MRRPLSKETLESLMYWFYLNLVLSLFGMVTMGSGIGNALVALCIILYVHERMK